ncbi:MAG: hypothetical protein ACWA6U_00265 [Breznakibacter sp.]
MTKNSYLIYALTYWCGLTQFFIGIVAPVLIILIGRPELHFAFFIISLLVCNVIVWYFVRKYLLQPIEIILTDERIIINYLNINLSKTKKSLSTTTDKISRFSDFSNGRDLKFKLYFNQGQTFTLYKSGLWKRKDDFELLVNDFKIFIENSNTKNTNDNPRNDNKKIKYGDNTYLNFALIFFGFAFFGGLIFINSICSKSEMISYKGLFGFLILSSLGILNLYIHQKLKRKIEDK